MMRSLSMLALVLVGCTTRSPGDATQAPTAVKPKGKMRIIDAPAEPAAIEKLVMAKSAECKTQGRTLLVYAGAKWCEPCKRFHEAVESGALDADFGDVDVLAFDVDFDNERLAYGNYETGSIPLLAVPGPDGKSTTRYMNGSIKGDGAVSEMTPRLKTLLGR